MKLQGHVRSRVGGWEGLEGSRIMSITNVTSTMKIDRICTCTALFRYAEVMVDLRS